MDGDRRRQGYESQIAAPRRVLPGGAEMPDTPNQIDEADSHLDYSVTNSTLLLQVIGWLISISLRLARFCAKFYCALSSVWKTSSHFPVFFTQTLALLYVPDMSLPSEVCCIVDLYLTTATSVLGKTTFMSANE